MRAFKKGDIVKCIYDRVDTLRQNSTKYNALTINKRYKVTNHPSLKSNYIRITDDKGDHWSFYSIRFVLVNTNKLYKRILL